MATGGFLVKSNFSKITNLVGQISETNCLKQVLTTFPDNDLGFAVTVLSRPYSVLLAVHWLSLSEPSKATSNS